MCLAASIWRTTYWGWPHGPLRLLTQGCDLFDPVWPRLRAGARPDFRRGVGRGYAISASHSRLSSIECRATKTITRYCRGKLCSARFARLLSARPCIPEVGLRFARALWRSADRRATARLRAGCAAIAQLFSHPAAAHLASWDRGDRDPDRRLHRGRNAVQRGGAAHRPSVGIRETFGRGVTGLVTGVGNGRLARTLNIFTRTTCRSGVWECLASA